MRHKREINLREHDIWPNGEQLVSEVCLGMNNSCNFEVICRTGDSLCQPTVSNATSSARNIQDRGTVSSLSQFFPHGPRSEDEQLCKRELAFSSSAPKKFVPGYLFIFLVLSWRTPRKTLWQFIRCHKKKTIKENE